MSQFGKMSQDAMVGAFKAMKDILVLPETLPQQTALKFVLGMLAVCPILLTLQGSALFKSILDMKATDEQKFSA